jgi:hypothetical protein
MLGKNENLVPVSGIVVVLSALGFRGENDGARSGIEGGSPSLTEQIGSDLTLPMVDVSQQGSPVTR